MQVLLVSRHVTQLCKLLIPILCPARNQFTLLPKTAIGTKMESAVVSFTYQTVIFDGEISSLANKISQHINIAKLSCIM